MQANIRAAACLGWHTPPEGSRHSIEMQGYVDGTLYDYQETLDVFDAFNHSFGAKLALYAERVGAMSEDERVQFINELRDENNVLPDVKYTDLPIGGDPKPLTYEGASILGDRAHSENYSEQTYDQNKEAYRLLAEGSREELERFTGVSIDPQKLEELYELRAQVVLEYQSNVERMNALFASVPEKKTAPETSGAGAFESIPKP